MKTKLIAVIFLVLMAGSLLISCKKSTDNSPVMFLNVGLVGGPSGFSDAGFNQAIWTGCYNASKDFHMNLEGRPSITLDQYKVNVDYFVAKGCNIIIAAGYDAAEATQAAAAANPGISFVILDYSAASPPSNLLNVLFDVDQASFPCGFVAAWWEWFHNTTDPKVGFVGGPSIPSIRQFSVSYAKGVEYFNTLYHKNVQTLGYYASSFIDSLQGARLADSLLKQNVNTVFAFGGPTGNGALFKMKQAGKWGIGVDVDQYYSTPGLASSLLTSCTKELTVVSYGILQDFFYAKFAGGTTLHANLGNKGVSMAPFHDFNTLIPDSVKNALTQIKSGIINGTIKTGWPE